LKVKVAETLPKFGFKFNLRPSAMAGVAAASCALTYWLIVAYGGGLYIFGDTYLNYSMVGRCRLTPG
jgi:hypothetical protein